MGIDVEGFLIEEEIIVGIGDEEEKVEGVDVFNIEDITELNESLTVFASFKIDSELI